MADERLDALEQKLSESTMALANLSSEQKNLAERVAKLEAPSPVVVKAWSVLAYLKSHWRDVLLVVMALALVTGGPKCDGIAKGLSCGEGISCSGISCDPIKPPIPEQGLRVLMVYETEQMGSYPPSQRVVLSRPPEIVDYCTAKCAKEPDGKTPAFMTFDQNTFDKYPDSFGEAWREAMKRERKSLPWILISNGRTGYEGPLPITVQDTLELIKKYGG